MASKSTEIKKNYIDFNKEAAGIELFFRATKKPSNEEWAVMSKLHFHKHNSASRELGYDKYYVTYSKDAMDTLRSSEVFKEFVKPSAKAEAPMAELAGKKAEAASARKAERKTERQANKLVQSFSPEALDALANLIMQKMVEQAEATK